MHQIAGQDGQWSKQFHNALTVYEPGSAAEKKLVRKIDMHIVCLALPPTLSIVNLKRHPFYSGPSHMDPVHAFLSRQSEHW